MPVYHFNLRDGGAGVSDEDGIELADLTTARTHAEQTARELMAHEELRKRPWRLDVMDGAGKTVWQVPFATVDPTLDHLAGSLRQLIERVSDSQRVLSETLFHADLLSDHFRAAEARQLGKPYLAARLGHRVDKVPSR